MTAPALMARAEPEPTSRPPLRIVHCDDPPVAEVADLPVNWAQGELPLPWRSASSPARAAVGLASYPALPLEPGIPRPEPFIAHTAALVADVLAGARPATQLARCASLDLQQRLARRAARSAGRRPWSGRGARVSSTNAMVVAPRCVLVAMVFVTGATAHAAALRMEFRHGRWQATDIQTPG